MVKRALAIVTLALCALTPGALLVAAPPASAAVDKEISWALDFLYARQRADGGFSLSGTTGSAFETPYAMYAVTAGDQALSKWKAGGKTPVAYLQSLDLEATALATSPRNPPVFYAKCILAYRAAGRRDLIYYAGNKGIDLVTKMNAYRNASLGYYASQAGGGGLYEISTTAWAMLALSAANETDDGKITDAAQWLRTVDAAGGYPVEPGEPEEVDATAIAILALRAADDVSSSAANTARIASALAFVKGCQKTSGGFTDRPGGDTANTAATGWAVQAIRAAGESPGDVTTGAAGAKTPLEFLRNAQLASGAFGLTLASGRTTLATTSLGTIGLRSGAYLPVKGDGNPASPNFRPYFVKNSVKPANGAVFTTCDGHGRGRLRRHRARHRDQDLGDQGDGRRDQQDEARVDLEVAALAQARQPLLGHSQCRDQDRRQGRQRAFDDAVVHGQGGDPVDAHPDAHADLSSADHAARTGRRRRPRPRR